MDAGLTTRIDSELKDSFKDKAGDEHSRILRILVRKFVNDEIKVTYEDIEDELLRDLRFKEQRAMDKKIAGVLPL